MRSIRGSLRSLMRKGAYLLVPRPVRRGLVKILIGAEESAPPREAARWLLGVYDDVALEIDQACQRWGNGVHIKHELMDGIHSFFSERIPAHSRVLDLGCGLGTVADAIARSTDSQVLGIDMNPDSIMFAKQHYQSPRLQFVCGDVFSDIPDSRSFDIIVLSSVLEHLENRTEFLRDLSTKFRPQKFLIRVPTFEQHYFKAVKRELGLFAYVDPTHVLEYSNEGFLEEMKMAGLEVRQMEVRWGDIWAECAIHG